MIDLTPLDVRKKRGDIPRVMRGYDPEEVDTFLEIVADRMEDLVKENMRLQDRSQRLEDQVEALRGRENAVHEALVTAQELSSEIGEQAKREARIYRRETEAEIRRLEEAVEARIERSLREADQLLEERREAIRELERMRTRFLRSIRGLLEKELDSVAVEEARESPLEPGDLELDMTDWRERLHAVRTELEITREAREVGEEGAGTAEAPPEEERASAAQALGDELQALPDEAAPPANAPSPEPEPERKPRVAAAEGEAPGAEAAPRAEAGSPPEAAPPADAPSPEPVETREAPAGEASLDEDSDVDRDFFGGEARPVEEEPRAPATGGGGGAPGQERAEAGALEAWEAASGTGESEEEEGPQPWDPEYEIPPPPAGGTDGSGREFFADRVADEREVPPTPRRSSPEGSGPTPPDGAAAREGEGAGAEERDAGGEERDAGGEEGDAAGREDRLWLSGFRVDEESEEKDEGR